MQGAVADIREPERDGRRLHRLSVVCGTPKLRDQPRQTSRNSHYSRRTDHAHVMRDKRLIYSHNVSQIDDKLGTQYFLAE